jgi:hypothetical protein
MQGPVMPGLDHATDPARLYSVRTHETYGLYAGRTARGQQLLAAVDGSRLLVVLFDEAGDLIQVVRLILPSSETTARYLAQNFGYEGQPIRVKQFHVPPDRDQAADVIQQTLIGESGLAVAPFPTLLREFLSDPSDYNAEDYANYCEMLSRWIGDNNFVLYWGNEYHLNSDGVVLAS